MSENVPKVRFDGFSGAWKSNKLQNLAKFFKGSGYTKQDIVKSGTPIIFYGRLYTKYETIISKVDTFVDLRNNSVVSEGDEVIVPSSGESAEDIARASFVKMPGIILGGDLNIIKPSASVSPSFLALTISNGNQKKELAKKAQGKSIVHLHNSDLKEVILTYPPIEEQQKIGDFFKQLDDTIALHQKLVEQQQQYKKAMLQKMFPQKGERVPKIRFEGFTGAWEIRKFKDFISKAGKKNSSGKDYVSYSVSNKLGLVRQGEQFEGRRLDDLDKTAYKLVNPNEFAYNPARINVGSIGFNNLGSTVIVSSLYVVLKMSDKINNEYILQFIKSANFIKEVQKNTEGSVREYLFYENFKNIRFPYPSNYEEQQKIGSFFKKLDDTIALHQKKLEDYQQLKKALLKRMFV